MLFQSSYHFPHPLEADPDGHGVIAVGGDLQPLTLLHAYSMGLFPWFNPGEPIAWWSPEPRCVVYPHEFLPKKSLKKRIKKCGYWLTLNLAFEEVIEQCASVRAYSEGTWITDDMIQAYIRLHGMGFAHSLEVWSENPFVTHSHDNICHATCINPDAKLVGGLYGLKLGKGFFGESMFHKETDASKIAFMFLTKLCAQTGIELIDCQLENDHLMSLGAVTLARVDFLAQLEDMIVEPTVDWQSASNYVVDDGLNKDKPADLRTTELKTFDAITLLDSEFTYGVNHE